MKFLVEPGVTTSENDLPSVKAHENLIKAHISRTIFRRLAPDIQLEYAKYHELPDAEALRSEQICDALFRESNLTSALDIKGHIRHPTASGVVVAKDVMDLVDWLVEGYTDASLLGSMRMCTPRDTYPGIHDEDEDDISEEEHSALRRGVQYGPDQVVERLPSDDLHWLADELDSAHTRVKAAVEKCRKATRDTIADVLILQGQLAEAKSYHAEVVKTVTSIVGVDAMQGIMERLDSSTRDSQLPCNIHQDMIQMETTRQRIPIGKATSRTQTAIPAPYHVISVVHRSLEGHCDGFPDPSNRKAHKDTRSLSPGFGQVGMKRIRDTSDDGYKVETASSTPSEIYDLPHKHKKRRFGERPQSSDTIPIASECHVADTISNYPSGDDNATDSTYLDSSGTERDFVDDPYEFHGFRGEAPDAELWDSDEFESLKCPSEDNDYSDSEHHIPWSSTEDEDCCSDPDYVPPDFDLEDIFELEEKPDSPTFPVHPLYEYKYMDEVLDCGGMSDGGISTDDSDQGYLTREMLQRPIRRYLPKSLGRLAQRPSWYLYEYEKYGERNDEETRLARMKYEIVRAQFTEWVRVEQCLVCDPDYVNLDIDQRLDDVLASDHSHYYFDDMEWKSFVEPSPGVPFRMDDWPYM